MQARGWLLVSGIHKLAPDQNATPGVAIRKGTKMSDMTSDAFNPTSSIFSRFMAAVDRLLLAWHEASVRNGDVPYFGL